MDIIGVILSKELVCECKSTNICDMTELLKTLFTYRSVFLALKDELGNYSYYNMIKLYSTQPMYREDGPTLDDIDTWDELTDYLTGMPTEMLALYEERILVPNIMEVEEGRYQITPFRSNLEEQLKVCSLENTIGFTIEYANHAIPFYRESQSKTWNLPDLALRQEQPLINMSGTIPIINGRAFYREVWTNPDTHQEEMFIHQAGRWLMHSNWNGMNTRTVKHKYIPSDHSYKPLYVPYAGNEQPSSTSYQYNKNMLAIDFSEIGSIELIKLSDCLEGKVLGTDTTIYNPPVTDDINKSWIKRPITGGISSSYTISFKLPSINPQGIPIVCICGRLYYPHDGVDTMMDGDQVKVVLTIDHNEFKHILLSNMQWFDKHVGTSTMLDIKVYTTLSQLFIDPLIGNGTPEDAERYLYEDLSIPFVIWLTTDKRIVTTTSKPEMLIRPDKLLFQQHAGGILMNRKTREVVDYVRIPYDRGVITNMAMQRPLCTLLQEDVYHLMGNAVGYERSAWVGKNRYIKFPAPNIRDIDNYVLVDVGYTEMNNEY